MVQLSWLSLQCPGLWLDLTYAAGVYYRHCTFKYNSYIYAFFSCFVFAYGGGFLGKLLTGDGLITPVIGNIGEAWDGGANLILWFLIFFTPFKHLISFFPIKVIMAIGQATGWMRMICDYVDLSLIRYPTSIFGTLLLSAVAGCGGGIFEGVEKVIFRTQSTVSTNGFKVSLALGILYYSQHSQSSPLLGLPVPIATKETTRCVITLLLILWNLLDTFAAISVNPFSLWEDFFERYVVTPVKVKVPKDSGTSKIKDN